MRVTFDSWQEFARDYWDKKPVVFRAPFAEPLFRFPGYFDTLVAAAEAQRRGALADPADVRVLLDHGTVMPGFLSRYLPRPEDGALGGYVQRVSASSQSGFCLVVNSFQQFSFELWRGLADFMQGLYAQAGELPGLMTDCHIITGKYGEAPTRAHKDTAGVFTLVLEGRKRMYVWPFEYFSQHTNVPDARYKQVNLDVDYREHLGAAQLLEGEAGDILYWPAPYWHCAESDKEAHATLHIASYFDGNPLRSVQQWLSQALAARMSSHWVRAYPYDARRPSEGGGAAFQGAFSEALKEAGAVVADALPRELRTRWLRRASAVNFEIVPPLQQGEPLSEAELLAGDPHHPILYQVEGEGSEELICAANGHSFRIPANPKLVRLLDRLNAGQPTRVSELLAEASGAVEERGMEFEAEPSDVLALLSHLRRMRAVSVKR